MSGTTELPRCHPSVATLAEHAGGNLSSAHRLIVDWHAEHCLICQGQIRQFEAVGGALLDAMTSAPLSPGALKRALTAIEDVAPAADVRDVPWLRGAVAGVGIPSWRSLGPGVRHATLLREPEGTLHLLRVSPGRSLPHHGHRGLELTVVVEGQFRDGDARFFVHDVDEADEDRSHDQIAEGFADCMCLIATSARVRFTGWLLRILQPLLPF